MGASQSPSPRIQNPVELIPRSSFQLPPAHFCVEDIHFIPVTMPVANYILSMIHEVCQLFNHSSDPINPPNYWKIIKTRLEHFNVIESNIIDNKYKNVGEIFADINSVWKSMYELSSLQCKENTQHDPKSDFITFAAGIESEFYNLWDAFELLLVKKHYLKESTPLSSTKTTKWTLKHCTANKTNSEKEKTESTNCNTPPSHQSRNSSPNNGPLSPPNHNSNNAELNLKDWLTNTVQLGQYYDVFVRNGFDDLSFVIDIIQMEDLEEMKIEKLGHRRKILTFAKRLSPNHKKRRFIQEDEEINQENTIDFEEEDGYQEPKRKRHRTNDD